MTVIFQSHHQFEFCDRILQSWSEDDCDSLFVFTSSPEASLASLKLLQLFSPLVRDIVKELPSSSAASPLTIIMPDTDASAWECLMGLLTNGSVDVRLPSGYCGVECQKNEISSLAKCLQINLGSDQVLEEARTKLRVKRPEELLEGESLTSLSNQENNIVNNDYDSDKDDVRVPATSGLSDLGFCDSSSLGSSPLLCVPPPPENLLIDNLDMIEVPGLKERRKIILTWKKRKAMNTCLDETDETMTEEDVASSCSVEHSNSIKDGGMDHTPKVTKLSYAAWKAKRAELKLQQKITEAVVTELGIENNNVINSNQVENNNSWSGQNLDLQEKCPRCSKMCKTKESLFYHFNATHKKTKTPFDCLLCPGRPGNPRLRFAKKTDLYSHLSRIHESRIKQGFYIIDREKATFEYETECFPWTGLDRV